MPWARENGIRTVNHETCPSKAEEKNEKIKRGEERQGEQKGKTGGGRDGRREGGKESSGHPGKEISLRISLKQGGNSDMSQISPKQHSKQEDDVINGYKIAQERLVS